MQVQKGQQNCIQGGKGEIFGNAFRWFNKHQRTGQLRMLILLLVQLFVLRTLITLMKQPGRGIAESPQSGCQITPAVLLVFTLS